MLNPFLLFAKLYLLRFCSYQPKSKMAAGRRLGKFWVAISPKRVIQYIHVWFCGGVVGIGGSIGTICVSIKSKMTHMEDTCITRFFITWKNSSPMNASQCSGRFTGSHHEYTLSEPTAFDHGTWSTADNMAPQHLERWFCYKSKSTFGPFLLDQTMNTHFLSPLQWLILLPGFTWEPCHPWKTKTL